MPLAVSATTLQRTQSGDVDERPHVCGELVEQVEVLHPPSAATAATPPSGGALASAASATSAHLLEAGVAVRSDGPRTGTA